MSLRNKKKETIKADLLRLADQIGSRRLDYEFCKKKVPEQGEIVYIIDSDVFKLYSNPLGEGVDRGARRGYTQLFRGSEKNIAQNLGVMLADYIFNVLSPKRPLVVFEAQLHELENIHQAVLRDTQSHRLLVNTGSSSQKLEKMLEIITELQETDSSTSREIESRHRQLDVQVKTSSEQIIKSLVYGKELARINTLLDADDPRLTGVGFLLENHSEEFEADYFRDTNDVFMRAIIKSELKHKLEKITPSKKPHLRHNDIEALYNLLMINKNLVFNKVKKRFVLISGDEAIIEASTVLDSYIKNWPCKGNFSELFIRNPRAFLNDEKFIGDLDFEALKEDLLNEVIPGVSTRRTLKLIENDINKFDDLCSLFDVFRHSRFDDMADAEFESRVSSLPSIFDKFLEGRIVAHAPRISSRLGDQAVDDLIQKIKSTDIGSSKYLQIIDDANNYLIEQTNATALNLQKEQLQGVIKSEKLCYRVPPLLRFGVLEEAREYIQSWVYKNEDNAGLNPKALLAKVESKDPSGYSVTLCNAALWAYLDEWEFVEENAGRAIRIALEAKTLSKANYYVGHEAAYLYLVAQRHLMNDKTKSEIQNFIKNSKLLLDITRLLWDRFRHQSPASNFEPSDVEYRFAHEELSIELMEIWYKLFYYPSSDLDEQEVGTVKNDLKRIMHSLYQLVIETKNALNNLGSIKKSTHQYRYLQYTQRHALNNFCFVYIVLNKHPLFNAELGEVEIREALSIYTNSEASEIKVKSYLHAVIMSVSYALYSDNPEEKSQFQLKAIRQLVNDNIEKYSKKAYEKKRFDFLIGLIT